MSNCAYNRHKQFVCKKRATAKNVDLITKICNKKMYTKCLNMSLKFASTRHSTTKIKGLGWPTLWDQPCRHSQTRSVVMHSRVGTKQRRIPKVSPKAESINKSMQAVSHNHKVSNNTLGGNASEEQVLANILLPEPQSFDPLGPAILDQLFDDTDYAMVDKQILNLGLKLEKQVLPTSPGAHSTRDLRGVLCQALEYGFKYKFLNISPVHNCRFFTAYYFPPWHFLAHFRKTRPSFVGLTSGTQQFNGNAEMKASRLLTRRSKNPSDYAFLRGEIRRQTRLALWTSLRLQPQSVDGVYLFFSRMYPYPNNVVGQREVRDLPGLNGEPGKVHTVPLTELDVEMDQAVASAAKLARGPEKKLKWVDSFNRKVDWKKFENKALHNKLRWTRIAPGEGLDWRNT